MAECESLFFGTSLKHYLVIEDYASRSGDMTIGLTEGLPSILSRLEITVDCDEMLSLRLNCELADPEMKNYLRFVFSIVSQRNQRRITRTLHVRDVDLASGRTFLVRDIEKKSHLVKPMHDYLRDGVLKIRCKISDFPPEWRLWNELIEEKFAELEKLKWQDGDYCKTKLTTRDPRLIEALRNAKSVEKQPTQWKVFKKSLPDQVKTKDGEKVEEYQALSVWVSYVKSKEETVNSVREPAKVTHVIKNMFRKFFKI